MRVPLGALARTGIESRLETDVAAGAEQALRYYVRRLDSDDAPVAYPRFRRTSDCGSDGVAEVELSLDAGVHAALVREARRQAIPVEQLLAHAVLVYLADMEAASAAAP